LCAYSAVVKRLIRNFIAPLLFDDCPYAVGTMPRRRPGPPFDVASTSPLWSLG
jgi:hypothetical protein